MRMKIKRPISGFMPAVITVVAAATVIMAGGMSLSAQAADCYSFNNCFEKGYASGVPEEKIEYFTRTLEKWRYSDGYSNHAIAYNNRGNAYRNLKQYDKAIADYDKAIEINPEDADAYNNRGILNFTRGKRNAGLADLKKSVNKYSIQLSSDAGNSSLYNGRGWSALWLGKCESAKSDFKKAIELDEKEPLYYDNLGVYWWTCRKNKGTALKWFEKSFKRGFDQWGEHYQETSDGHFLKGLNDTPEFRALVEKYKK